jgi:hypothetical protein
MIGTTFMWSLLIAICIGLIPALIAESKGRSFMEWWAKGLVLFIVVFPHSLLIEPIRPTSPERSPLPPHCNQCGVTLTAGSTFCNECGSTPLQALSLTNMI